MTVSFEARLERKRRAELMAEAYEMGMNTREIGELFGLDRSQVSRDLRNIVGLTLRPKKVTIECRSVACAVCGALPGNPCKGPSTVIRYHLARRRAGAGTPTPWELVGAWRKRWETDEFFREEPDDVVPWREAARVAERMKTTA